MNNFSLMDRFINQIDDALRTIFTTPASNRPNPAIAIPEQPLDASEKKSTCAYMRINHTGEVCAQALYRGQMVAAKRPETIAMLKEACHEETDHLAWTAERIHELGGRKSLFNISWYTKSFCIGVIAGLAGDKYSLGFIHETEQQVGRHLEKHLQVMPQNDHRSRAIVSQMHKDELRHADHAEAAGGKALPAPIKTLMTLQSKVMTTLTYWL